MWLCNPCPYSAVSSFADLSQTRASTFDEHDILWLLYILFCQTAKITNYSRPGQSLSDARLLELQAQITNFEAPDWNFEPLTDSEDSEGEQEAQLQARLESEDMWVNSKLDPFNPQLKPEYIIAHK